MYIYIYICILHIHILGRFLYLALYVCETCMYNIYNYTFTDYTTIVIYTMSIYVLHISTWRFGTFFHILGIASSQITLIFFRGAGIPPNRLYMFYTLVKTHTKRLHYSNLYILQLSMFYTHIKVI